MTDRIEPTDYLLGELDSQGMAEAERLMSEDETFRVEVERLRPVIGVLEGLPNEVWDAPEPPPLRHPELDTAPSFFSRLFRPIGIPAPVLGVAAALVLLAGVIVGSTVFGSTDDSGGGEPLALASIGDGDGTAVGEARLEGDGTQLNVSVQGLAANAPAEVYEVWLLTGSDGLLSLGSFRVGDTGSAVATVSLPVDLTTFESIDISREPVDGDPTHSSDSVLRGPTA